MTKEFYDLSSGRQLFLLRPRDLLSSSAALDVEVSPASREDAGRDIEIDSVGEWTSAAVLELLSRLDAEGQPQADVIREAARLGGIIRREAVYELCGYDDGRMLRGFTRPAARITAGLQRDELVDDPVAPILTPLYPDGVRASGFRVPPEVVTILRGTKTEPTPPDDRSVRTAGMYLPLTQWLADQTLDSIPVTFAQVEEILGTPLADSARNYQPYWYSAPNSLALAITAGGFRASQVNLTAETATLVRR